MNRHFLYIDELGNAALVTPSDNTLRDTQTMVDGLIDVVTGWIGGRPVDIFVNDEGLYRPDFGINLVASVLTGRQLVGPAVIAMCDQHGNTVGLTDAHIARIINEGMMIDDKTYTAEQVANLRREAIES